MGVQIDAPQPRTGESGFYALKLRKSMIMTAPDDDTDAWAWAVVKTDGFGRFFVVFLDILIKILDCGMRNHRLPEGLVPAHAVPSAQKRPRSKGCA